jgi:tetratricopeptide (TPR) repeat protein
MRPRNVFLALVTLCALVGIASIYPKSQSSAQVDVKKAAAQPVRQPSPGETSSECDRILMQQQPLVSIAGYLGTVKQNDQALKLVEKMQSCGIKFDRAREYDTVYSLAAAGQIDQALQVANSIENNGMKGAALQRLAEILAEAGKYEQALEIANTIANTDEAKTHKHEAFANIARKLASSGQIDRALQLANRLDGDSKASALSHIATTLASSGQFDSALQVANRLNGDSKASALSRIASTLASSGQFDRGLQLVKTIEIEPAKPIALARLAESLTDAKQLEQVLQMAKTIKADSRGQQLMLSHIGLQFC